MQVRWIWRFIENTWELILSRRSCCAQRKLKSKADFSHCSSIIKPQRGVSNCFYSPFMSTQQHGAADLWTGERWWQNTLAVLFSEWCCQHGAVCLPLSAAPLHCGPFSLPPLWAPIPSKALLLSIVLVFGVLFEAFPYQMCRLQLSYL